MPPQTDDKHNSPTRPQKANAMLILIALTFAGGFADAASYLLTGSFTGHITGNTVLAGIDLATGKFGAFGLHITAVVAFLLATAGGLLLSRLGLRRNVTLALALVIEAALIGVAPLHIAAHNSHTKLFELVCLCLALGLQNGTFSKSEGVSVHATYITGDATSLLASILRRKDARSSEKTPDNSKDTALGVIWPSFAIGALIAGLAVHYWGADAFWLLEAPLLLGTVSAILAQPLKKV